MSISSVSNSTNLQSSQMSDAFKQRKQDFAALASALQSGDLAGAQKAFATLQQDKLAIGQAQGGQGNNSSAVSQSSQGGATSMQDLMNQLKQALSSGDLQGAQQAFASLQQNMQANRGHGHHHHHGGGSQPSSSSTASVGNVTATSSTAQAGGISTTA